MEGFYRIRDFKNLYLTYDIKDKKGWLTWIKTYVRHDGEAYRRIIAHERHESILLCFFLILQVSANMPKRGDLINENGPITAEGLAYRTGIKAKSFEIALEILVHPQINWIEYTGKILGTKGKSVTDKKRVEEKRVEEKRVEHPPTPQDGGNPQSDLAVAVVEEGTIFSRSVDIREGWNNFAKSFPKDQQLSAMKILTPKRVSGFKKHMEMEGFDLALILVKIRESDHLKGLNGWKVDFDWIFCPKKEGVDNWLKIMEGKYDNRKITPPKSARELREERAMQESMKMADEADRRDRELAKEGDGK